MSKTSSVLSFALVLFTGCGVTPTANSGTTPSSPQSKTEVNTPTVTWETVADPGELREYVRESALARAREDAPELNQSLLAGWRKDHASAPELSGHAVEHLLELAIVDLTAGNLDDAEGTVRLVRERAKNRNSAFAGTSLLAVVASKRAGADDAARIKAVEAVFRELPQERFGASTVAFHLFQSPEQLTARSAQAKQQMVSLDTATSVLTFDQMFPEIVSHRPAFLAAIDAVSKSYAKAKKPKKYAFSTVKTNGGAVHVGVWDVGTNPDMFKKQLYVNAQEELNGKDDDGDGQIDDRNGVASDGQAPNTALLYQPDPKVLEEYKPLLKGIMDLRAGLTTTEDAKKVLALFAGASSAEAVETLETNLSAVGEWAHGTHVAGLLLQDLPKAKLSIFRSAWAGEARIYHHRGPTDAELDAERANMLAVCDYINKNEVRVVNASLGFATDYLENELSYEKDKYKSDVEVRARAKAVQAKRRANWRETFEKCPNTLFVIAAGNSNRDVVEYEDTPADLTLPNVLPVGAVDDLGKWAIFTNSNPAQVRVFDFGVAVTSVIPSGEKVPLSGTSMASPNAANAAAKVIAANPKLSPSEVVSILVETGDEIAPPFNGRIVNEKKAVLLAKKGSLSSAKLPAK